jgi:PAS domain S-box-containing protein
MKVMKKGNTSKNQSKIEISHRESEQRYRTTMMSVGDGVIATDTEGRVEMMNPVAEVLTGWKQEKARGKSLEEIFHIINEETRNIVENPVRRVMREGIVVGLANHSVLIAKDGTEHPIADSGAPIRNEKSEITGVVLVFRDQTQERTAQKALQESERKFRETIKYLDEGYYSCMMDGVVLEHNQAFNRILGLDISKDMKGSKLPDFWQNPEERKVYLQELMTSGFITNFLINAKTISGEKLVVMVNSHLVKDERSEPVRIEGTFTDFTRLKIMEEALKENETKYRTLFENAQVGMYRSKIDGSAMLDVNKKFGEILGLTREESLGKAGRILWADPEDRNKMMKLIKEQDGILYNYEARLLAKNGEVRNVLASIELQPEVGSLEGTFVDITERKRAEEQLRKLNRIYSLLSDINQAIVRSRVPEELFEKVCNIAVGQGGFGMAWLGLIDGSSQKLQVIAQACRTTGYLQQVKISLTDEPLSYCPVDSALRQGKHFICNINENEEMSRCQKNAYELGFRSSASFPLKVSDIMKGALTFYSDEPYFFDEAELKLLDELALDISFAMEYAEKETGRKQAEEALRESEVRFRIAAETSNDVVYEWDLKQEVIWFGKIDEMLGYAPGEFPRTLEGLGASVHQEDWIHVMAAVQAHLDGRAPYAEDYRVLMKDGTIRWWSARGAVARMPDGKPVRWIGTVTDITERKQAEEALKISKERLLFATEGANLGIWNWNIVTGELFWSDQCKALFGVPPDETMSYQRFSDALHPDDRKMTDEAVKDSLDNHKDFDIEYRSLWPDESIHWLAAKGRGFYDAAGKAVRLEGIVLDITGRKQEEETLRIKNQVFEDSIASQSIADSTGMITHVNPAFLRLWGYSSKEQAIGNSVGSFFANQADAVPVLEALATNDAWEGEFRAKRTDGTTFISRGFATSLRDTKGKIVGYQSTNLDVTKEREAEEEIIKLNTELEDRVIKRTVQLEASNKELEAFSYSVSHDLRAPLRHVSGYVELLNKHFQSELTEKGKHYLNSIADSVRVMGVLIDDLLQFSRTGRMEMLQSNLDMNEILLEVKESLCKENPDRKIEWVLGKLASVYGDEAMLRLVWVNLLSNAVKFTRTRKKARIEIGVRKENKELVFFVRDNGVGFDMQYAQKLFGVFQRMHPTEEFEGTGIGLANVQRIVSRHGGRVWAEAEIDNGAVFYFSVPIK